MTPSRFLFVLAASAAVGGTASAQFRGFGGGAPDPNTIWQFTAGGDVPSIDLNQRTDIRERLQRRGTPIPANGILTKEAFIADFQQRMAQGGGAGGPPGGAPGGMGGGPPGGFGGGGFNPAAMTDDQLKGMMQRYDKNGDGKISLDEASDRMKPNFAQYDKNGDGGIDIAEYRGYMVERFGQRTDGNTAPAAPAPAPPPQYATPSSDRRDDRGRGDDRKQIEEDVVVRPTVVRFGKLPKEVPSWFEQLDTDADGQVGLYEWRAATRVTTEFVDMDLNADGYLTAEEWIRFTKAALEKKPTDSLASADGGSPGASDRGGRGGFGDRNGFSRGGPPMSSSDRGSFGDRSKDDRSKEERKSEKDDRGRRNPFTGR